MAPFVVGLIQPYAPLVAVIFAAMVLETAMSLAAPWPLKFILDNVVGKHPIPEWISRILGDAAGDDRIKLAGVAAAAFVLVAVVGAVAGYIDNYFTEGVGQRVARDLRLEVYAHLERVSLSYYDRHETSVLLSTLTDDIATIQNFASGSTLSILVDLVTIVGMVGLMFWLNWDFALMATAVTPFLLFFVSRFRGAVKAATRDVRHKQSDVFAVLQQGLESIRAVKAFGRQELEQERLAAVSEATVAAALAARRVKGIVSPVVAVVVALCTAIVLWRGTALIIAGAMTVGALTVFLAYLSKFFKPVQDLAKMTNAIAQTTVGIERVRTLLDIDSIIPECATPLSPNRVLGAIAFENVSFAYDLDSPVLRGVTFAIEPGQTIGLVGATGSGKSTIMSLIPRFYDPTAGRILLDGADLREYGLSALRTQIGYVLQETILFRGTIRENIAYGRPDATDEEILIAAKIADADEFVSKMPRGYDSAVGERGTTLSGGQRQRIGIARAILRNAPILLLDEPTAALDTESERSVMAATERLMKGRTVITIAHRLSTIRDADTIVVLKEGVICEQGTHSALVTLGGTYADLVRLSDSSAGVPA